MSKRDALLLPDEMYQHWNTLCTKLKMATTATQTAKKCERQIPVINARLQQLQRNLDDFDKSTALTRKNMQEQQQMLREQHSNYIKQANIYRRNGAFFVKKAAVIYQELMDNLEQQRRRIIALKKPLNCNIPHTITGCACERAGLSHLPRRKKRRDSNNLNKVAATTASSPRKRANFSI